MNNWACVDCCGVSSWHRPVGGEASVRSEWMSSTASVSSIYGDNSKHLDLYVKKKKDEYRCFYFYRCTPPGQRHPSCRGRGPVLTVRLSSQSGIAKAWIAALVQGSENPPLPPPVPASKETRDLSRQNDLTATAAHFCISTSVQTAQLVEGLC